MQNKESTLVHGISEAERSMLKIDILGVCETWLPDAGEFVSNNAKTFYSANLNKNHRNGVGVIIKVYISKFVGGFILKSDRVMMIKITAKPL